MKLSALMVIATIVLANNLYAEHEEPYYSNEKEESVESRFFSLDLNHDGYLDRDEAKNDKMLVEGWTKADIDKDDNVSQGEYIIFEGEATAAGTSEEDEYPSD